MSLGTDLLWFVFVDPLREYFIRGLTLRRVIGGVIASIALVAGIYLAAYEPAPLSYVGWGLVALSMMYGLYDVATLHRAKRNR